MRLHGSSGRIEVTGRVERRGFRAPSAHTAEYTVKLWGAAGGGRGACGGNGGFVEANLKLSPGTTYGVVVGCG